MRDRAALTIVREALLREKNKECLAANSFWRDAAIHIENRARLRGMMPSLKQKIAVTGKLMQGEFKTIKSEPIPIGPLVLQAKQKVAGKDIENALIEFAKISEPQSKVDTQKLTEQVNAENPLQAILGSTTVDQDGRALNARPSVLSKDSGQADAAFDMQVQYTAMQNRSFDVAASIDPALQTIIREGSTDRSKIEKMLETNASIPIDRVTEFAKGIHYGLQDDNSTALKVMVPEIENMFRKLVEAAGQVPRYVENDGTEKYWMMDKLINHEAVQAELGSEFEFDFHSLLASKSGGNFRNNIAHGISPPRELNGDQAKYLFWLIVRFLISPKTI